MSAEVTPQMRVAADTARGLIHSWVAGSGLGPAKALAIHTLWVLGEVISEHYGRVAAIGMMDQTADALNAKAETSPAPEPIPGDLPMPPPGTMLLRIPTTAAEADEILRTVYAMRAGFVEAANG